jgi:hypothetical protein
MKLQVVEVNEEFEVHGYRVRPGGRVMAYPRQDGSWIVYFNGNDVPVRDGTVGAVGSSGSKKEATQVYSAARLEQYQLAPAKPA